MKLKPFDIEAARRGESVVLISSNGPPVPVRFVGQRASGSIAVESHDWGSPICSYQESALRMVPNPEQVWVVTWWVNGTSLRYMTSAFHEEEDANRYISDHKCELPHASPKITPVEIQP